MQNKDRFFGCETVETNLTHAQSEVCKLQFHRNTPNLSL